MSAAVAFADLGNFRTTSFPNVSRLEDDQFYFEPAISAEDCFEDIVGRSPALRKYWSMWLLLLRPIPRSCFMVRPAPGKSWSHAPFTT